jgi:hypothetical protein
MDHISFDARTAQYAVEDARLEARLDAARAWEVANYFGGCPTCGRTDGYLNVRRSNVFVCHTHKTAWCVGNNLFSDWRDETEEIWERNAALLAQYTEVESLNNPIFCGPPDGCQRCGAGQPEAHHPLCQRPNGTPTALADHLVRTLLEVGTPREVLKALIALETTPATVVHAIRMVGAKKAATPGEG